MFAAESDMQSCYLWAQIFNLFMKSDASKSFYFDVTRTYTTLSESQDE